MEPVYKKTILENGIRVVSHSMPGRHSVALGIWIKVGGRHESTLNKGISHFLEHLLFKGTKRFSCRGIKESIEGSGGSLNGFTSEEMTCYLVKIPVRFFDLALDVLSDMVLNPLLRKVDILKEKTVILEEIKMYKDLPQIYVYELLDGLLWPAQPLGMTITGTVESVCRIKGEDLFSFKEQYYTPLNIVVSAAGLLDHNRFVKSVKKRLSLLKNKTINRFLAAKEGQLRPQLKIFDKGTEQTHMALGFHSFKRDHPLRYALWLLHIILGANMSSRLFNEIREKRGLAYEIGTQLKRFDDTGAFIVHAGIDNRNVNQTVDLILKEFRRIKDKPVDTDELKRAKDFFLGQLILSLEDTLEHMLWIGESTAALDKIYRLDDVIRQVNRVSAKDIRQVARSILREDRINLALIGPLKDSQERLYKQLHM